MTSFLARAGSLETFAASRTIWRPHKRKRAAWLCASCRAARASPQWRTYSDDSLKITTETLLFPSRNSPVDDQRQHLQIWKPWGLERDSPAPSAAVEKSEAIVADRDIPEGEPQNALWEELGQMKELVEADDQHQKLGEETIDLFSRQPNYSDIDYVSILPQALANNEPDTVARCLYAARGKGDTNFIQSIPRTTYAECIRLLQPCNFTETLTSTHKDISDFMAKQLGIAPINGIAAQHAYTIRSLLGIRRSAGITLGLPEYRMLLQGSADLGQARSANHIWNSMIEDGVAPDTACYNHRMAAHAWSGRHRSESRQSARLIPYSVLKRQLQDPQPAFADYRIGEGGVKQQVMSIFSDMLKRGVVANEDSFRNVILASAKEGDVKIIKSVLRRIWGIDLDDTPDGDRKTTVAVPSIDKTSPLRPDSKLLFTLAYAFGINNDIPMALRAVDSVARRYDISIGLDVWDQLFEWTFVLACERTGTKANTEGRKTGQLPLHSVLHVWETMTGAPYFVKPTLRMYNYLIRNLQQRHSPRLMLEKMREGLVLFRASRHHAYRAQSKLKQAIDGDNLSSPAKSLETLRREFEDLDLVRRRNFVWFKRWLRLLLSTAENFGRADESGDFVLRDLPALLWEWRHYAPTTVRYESVGGIVTFEIRTEEEIEDAKIVAEERTRERARVAERVPLFLAEEWVTRKRRDETHRR